MDTSSLDQKVRQLDKLIKLNAKNAAHYHDIVAELQEVLSTVGDFQKEFQALDPKPTLDKEMVRSWIQQYPTIQDQAFELERGINQLQNKLVSTNLFLQEFRDYRFYVVGSLKEMAAFIERAITTLNSTSLTFKPVFVGTDDFSPVINQFKLQKEPQQQTYPVRPDQLYDFLPFLVTRKQFTKGVLATPEFKIILQTQKKILIESNNETIVRLDRLAKEMNVSALAD